MCTLPAFPVLRGTVVTLEPLSAAHAADLAIAAEENRDAYAFTGVPRAWEVEDYLAAHFARADSGRLAPFALIRRADGRAVGCSAYWDPRYWPGTDARTRPVPAAAGRALHARERLALPPPSLSPALAHVSASAFGSSPAGRCPSRPVPIVGLPDDPDGGAGNGGCDEPARCRLPRGVAGRASAAADSGKGTDPAARHPECGPSAAADGARRQGV